MPWPTDHKTLTRERIVQAAAAALRARGLAGVRVDEIMAQAGLTHGGFYAHFPSKDDLTAAAVEHAHGEAFERLQRATESVPEDQRLHAAIDAYLSRWHASHPDQGCPFPTLGAELARARGKTRRDSARMMRRRLDWMRTLVPSRATDTVSDRDLIGVMACMVGGLILARSIAGREESDALLEACREFLHTTLRNAARRRPARRSPRRRPTSARKRPRRA